MNAAGTAQHQVRPPGQPGLRVIPEDGSSSRYCKRMTEQESKRAKAIVMRLDQEGAGRAAMVKEISRAVLNGREVSKAMVDRLRDQLGLIQRQHGRAAKGQESMLRMEDYAVLHSTQNDDWTNHAPASSTQMSEGGVATAPQISQPEGPINEVFRDMETSRAEVETSLIIECRTNPSSSDDDTAMLDYQSQSQPSASGEEIREIGTLAGQESTLTHVFVGAPDPFEHEIIHSQHNSERSSHSFDEHSSVNGSAGEQPSQAYTLGTYFSSMQSSLWKWAEARDLPSLNGAAYIFHTLRDFQHAFVIYFIIYCRLLPSHEFRSPVGSPDPHFVLSAIGCARSAQTPRQVTLARSLIERVREQLRSCHGLSFLEHTRVWEILERSYKNSLDGEGKTWENAEETAYWSATGIVMNQPRLAAKYGHKDSMPDYFLSFIRHNSVVAHLYDCDVAMTSIRMGISKVSKFIRENREDPILRFKGFTVSHGDRTSFAKFVSSRVLRAELNRLAHERIWPSSTTNCADFPCNWHGLAILTIPFVLVEWTQRPAFQSRHASFLQRHQQWKFLDIMVLAADEILESMHSAAGTRRNKAEIIDLYLRSLAAPKHLKDEVYSTLPGWVLDIVAKVVDLDPITVEPNDSAPVSVLNPQSPGNIVVNQLSVPQDLADTFSPDAASLMSNRSSISSSYRSFREYSKKLSKSVSLTVRTRLSDSSRARTSLSSWSFSRNTGFPQDSSIRGSQLTLLSDVTMSG